MNRLKNPVLKPPALKKNQVVRLLAPSSRPVSRLEVERCINLVEKMGLKAEVGEHALDTCGYLAGDDQSRLADLNSALEDKNVSGIFFLRGGYGALRLIDKLNYNAILKNPKVIMGSHDASIILLAIHMKTRLNVFYGPNLCDFSGTSTAQMIASKLAHEGRLESISSSHLKEFEGLPYLSNLTETVEGRLIGGNLTALTSLMGTPYEVDFEDRIVFLNDTNERNDILYRWITQLRVARKFSKAKAVLFGQFHNCDTRGAYSMHSIKDMIVEQMESLDVPYILGFPMNEGGMVNVLPIGVKVKLDARHAAMRFESSATLSEA